MQVIAQPTYTFSWYINAGETLELHMQLVLYNNYRIVVYIYSL